jgi:arylsulfatase A-like enzyme
MPTAARFVIVFVVDGLRPDAITSEVTPTLWRLRNEGIEFTNSHAVFPTVTRVNAASIATGAQPGRHGIVGNQLYVPAVDPRRAFDTGNYKNLLALDEASGGRLVMTPTLSERLHGHGRTLVGVSSGSTGSSFLLNPRAPAGIGAVINGYYDAGRTVAYPVDLSERILAKFGPAPVKQGVPRHDAAVAWTERVLREHVLAELRPDVVINWLTEPDHTQHDAGVGSPAARETLEHDDREIARVLAALDDLGLTASADVLVVSDHGFTSNTAGVDVAGALIEAGLKAAPDSTDVVLASSGQAVGIHVEGHDGARVASLARLIQSRAWGGVVFTAGRAPGDPRGVAEGTFSLELIHLGNAERAPDLLLTFPWTSEPNRFGVPGADLASVSDGARLYASDHGSMSPWNVRNTLLAWGASFKRQAVIGTPVGNVDVTPTILALLGIADHDGLDGRVLAEALAGGPDPARVEVETRVHTVEAGAYRAALQVSSVAGRRYVDQSWRQ